MKQFRDPISDSASVTLPPQQRESDPLRRFTPTPYTAALPTMGRTVRLETNSADILNQMVELFASYPGCEKGCWEFTWKIINQADVPMSPPWPKRQAFSDDGLRFAEFGQRNFLAVDLHSRQGIGFISEGLAKDYPGFISPFIDTIFYLTAGSLGLVPLTSACIATGRKGLLLMGPPDSGKTTACYLAAKRGLDFHADQAVFLEPRNDVTCAWGDFCPAVFRPQTLGFIPELRTATRSFSYCELTFHYLDKRNLQPPRAYSVFPVCCVVLERNSALTPRLTRLTLAEFATQLSKAIPFRDDLQFESQRAFIIKGVERLPAYHLAYGADPGVVVPLLCELLTRHAAHTVTNSDLVV